VKKRYVFLIVSLAVIGSLTYYFDRIQKKENEFIKETERELDSLNKERDSVFYFADEVLNHIDEQKKSDSLKLSSLDGMVKNKQITIEQQVVELKSLLKKSNEMQEWAETERNKAIEVERMSKQQKMEAEKARKEVVDQLDSLKKVNHRLLDKNKFYEKENIRLQNEIEKLKDKIVKFQDDKKGTDYDNKKRKKGN
jgi:cell division septum initiation protein DivIVA